MHGFTMMNKQQTVSAVALAALITALLIGSPALADSGYRVIDTDGITSYEPPTRPDNVPWFVPRALYDAQHPSNDMQYVELYHRYCEQISGNGYGGGGYESCSDGVQDGPWPTKALCQAQLDKDYDAAERVNADVVFECRLIRNDY
jgi:hypothetical protein